MDFRGRLPESCTVSKTGAAIQLKASPLLGQLPSAVQERLIDMGHTRSAAKGDILYLQGDEGDRLYLIVSGTVRISASSADGRELNLNSLGPGEVMGEIALLDGGRRTATATR